MDGLLEVQVNGNSPNHAQKGDQLLTPTLSPVVEIPQQEEKLAENKNYNGAKEKKIKLERNISSEVVVNGKAEESSNLDSLAGANDESRKRSVSKVTSPARVSAEREKVLKLSSQQITELTNSPSSLPVRAASPVAEPIPRLEPSPLAEEKSVATDKPKKSNIGERRSSLSKNDASTNMFGVRRESLPKLEIPKQTLEALAARSPPNETKSARPILSSRTFSTPPIVRRKQSSQGHGPKLDSHKGTRHVPSPLQFDEKVGGSTGGLKPAGIVDPLPSPMPSSIPLPPLSIPTYLQLELSAERPSPLYIYRPAVTDFPYESSKVKFERLHNFLLLPPQLEQTLWFGALACLDAWLFTFTILPLRFFKALGLLAQWWGRNFFKEVHDLGSFVYNGLGRVWERRRQRSDSAGGGTPSGEGSHSRRPSVSGVFATVKPPTRDSIFKDRANPDQQRKRPRPSYRHRRTKSVPSTLLPNHKADILKGLLVLASCIILMRFDASRMYHGIRGQAAIKLYVIYNVLEVCDRLFSALGQDVLECLFSRETLERNADGRSKILRPFWMFLLALVYNVVHATALFYQVITLNVAVNSYSNALLTLLMSNQFVEIKGTVFKKFEKENLFQLTCADMVERFQLWLMLSIIAIRNIVEVGGLSIPAPDVSTLSHNAPNPTSTPNMTSQPLRSSTTVLPKSFTIFPPWTGQVFGPFLLVLGSEMVVDWIKHAYITKFNNTKPAVYGRFLDVLAKDYYSNAFSDQNLTKRLGLPVLPLSCLFIRAMVQTYHMLLATHMPLPLPSPATALSTDSTPASSPATTAALQHIDQIFRRALGRSSFGAGSIPAAEADLPFYARWTIDDAIALATMAVVYLAFFAVMLALKLLLGMALLTFARSRYRGMKERERRTGSVEAGGRRVGGWGTVEVDEDKRRWIYVDDQDGLRSLREREKRRDVDGGEATGRDGGSVDKEREREREREKERERLWGVERYAMVAKRIW